MITYIYIYVYTYTYIHIWDICTYVIKDIPFGNLLQMYWKWPIESSWVVPFKMVVFHSYVCFPEGNLTVKMMITKISIYIYMSWGIFIIFENGSFWRIRYCGFMVLDCGFTLKVVYSMDISWSLLLLRGISTSNYTSSSMNMQQCQ